jgi:hypothetical protein
MLYRDPGDPLKGRWYKGLVINADLHTHTHTYINTHTHTCTHTQTHALTRTHSLEVEMLYRDPGDPPEGRWYKGLVVNADFDKRKYLVRFPWDDMVCVCMYLCVYVCMYVCMFLGYTYCVCGFLWDDVVCMHACVLGCSCIF